MTEEVQVPAITVVDIAAMLRIIDTAAERGAYRGEELTAVGTVRDKAAAFIAHIREQAEAAEAAKAAEEGAEEVVEEAAE